MSWGKYLLTAALMTTIGLNTILGQDNNNKKNNRQIQIVIGEGTKYDCTKKHAERGIVKLNKTAKKEDSWIYYKNELIDTGHNEDSAHVQIHLFVSSIENSYSLDIYHNHPKHGYFSPPSLQDIVNNYNIEKKFPNNTVRQHVIDNDGRIWEFSLEEKLKKEFEGKSDNDKFKLIESKMNIAYTPENEYKFGGNYPCPYNPRSPKEYIKIMKEVGVKTKFRRPVIPIIILRK